MSSRCILIASLVVALAGCGAKTIEVIRFQPYDCGVVPNPDPVTAPSIDVHNFALTPEGWELLLSALLDWERSNQQMAYRLTFYEDCIAASKNSPQDVR